MSDSIDRFAKAHRDAGHEVKIYAEPPQAICLTCHAGIIPTTFIWRRNLPKDDES